MRVGSIHQPNFIPWLPFFIKMKLSDCFVILDHVEYSKNGWTNRCQVTNGKSELFLTIPINGSDTSLPINMVRVSELEYKKKYRKIQKTCSNIFSKKPVSETIKLLLKDELLEEKLLSKINLKIITDIASILGIDTQIKKSSENLENFGLYKSSELVEKICHFYNFKTYISGTGFFNYKKSHFSVQENLVLNLEKIPESNLNTLDFIAKNGCNSRREFDKIIDSVRSNIFE